VGKNGGKVSSEGKWEKEGETEGNKKTRAARCRATPTSLQKVIIER